MADLLWRRASDLTQIPARSVLPDGKQVHMEGRRYDGALPESFDLLRVYSAVIGTVARFGLGKPPWKHLEGDTWYPAPVDYATARTEPFPLKAQRFTGTHRWRFMERPVAGRTLFSPVIRTARFVDIGFMGHIGTPPAVPVDAQVGVKVTVPVGLADPKVMLEVILPWDVSEANQSTVHEVLRDELTDDEKGLDGDLYERVLGYLESYLPSTPPEGWNATMNPDVLEIEPGDNALADIEITAPPGTGVALAVRATNAENGDERSVSDVVIVERGNDGTFALLHAED